MPLWPRPFGESSLCRECSWLRVYDVALMMLLLVWRWWSRGHCSLVDWADDVVLVYVALPLTLTLDSYEPVSFPTTATKAQRWLTLTTDARKHNADRCHPIPVGTKNDRSKAISTPLQSVGSCWAVCFVIFCAGFCSHFVVDISWFSPTP